MKIIAMLERSAGNESVGNEWIETKIFESFDPLMDIIIWASEKTNSRVQNKFYPFHNRLMLQIAEEK